MADLPLFNHQARALDFLEDMPFAAITADMGTGKSRIIIEDAKRKGAVLCVVCPKTAIGVWKGELEKWGAKGSVINYEQTWRPQGQLFTKFIEEMRDEWGRSVMLVLDESHRIKDRTTKQSRSCRKLGRLADYRRFTTGVPAPNGIHDLWAQYDYLNPGILGKWKDFAEEHLIFNPMFPGKVDAVRNVEALQNKIAPYTFHVGADVLNLPEATDLYRTCELSGPTRRNYDSMEKNLWAEVDGESLTAANTLVKMLRLAQMTGGSEKMALFGETMEEIGKESVVVFTRFLEDHHRILKMLGSSAQSLRGGQSGEDRERTIRDFQGGSTRVLVAQLQAGAESIDLTAARYVVYFSVGFSFKDYYQSRARVLRQGQTRPCFYVHLQAADTIDGYIYRALSRKESIHDALQTWWRDHV